MSAKLGEMILGGDPTATGGSGHGGLGDSGTDAVLGSDGVPIVTLPCCCCVPTGQCSDNINNHPYFEFTTACAYTLQVIGSGFGAPYTLFNGTFNCLGGFSDTSFYPNAVGDLYNEPCTNRITIQYFSNGNPNDDITVNYYDAMGTRVAAYGGSGLGQGFPTNGALPPQTTTLTLGLGSNPPFPATIQVRDPGIDTLCCDCGVGVIQAVTRTLTISGSTSAAFPNGTYTLTRPCTLGYPILVGIQSNESIGFYHNFSTGNRIAAMCDYRPYPHAACSTNAVDDESNGCLQVFASDGSTCLTLDLVVPTTCTCNPWSMSGTWTNTQTCRPLTDSFNWSVGP